MISSTVDPELMSAFNAIDPASLDYEQWFKVSAVMHDEGLSEAEWDEWNRRDAERYTERINSRKWQSIKGDGRATKRSVFSLAIANGWGRDRDSSPSATKGRASKPIETKPNKTDEPPRLDLDKLDDPLRNHKDAILPEDMDPAEMMRRHLACMFRIGESVSIAGADQCRYNEKREKWEPLGGRVAGLATWHHNAETFLANHVNGNAGAWVRVNPCTGGKNEDVTRYASTLIESDDIDQARQLELFSRLRLPIRCVVDSGKKSMHAVCIIDAKDAKEYRRRVEWLRTYCDKNGLPTDHANINEGRYMRLAGAKRAGRVQRLVCESMGPQSWGEFRRIVDELAEDESDDSPKLDFMDMSAIIDEPIKDIDEVVQGLLPRERVAQLVARGGSGKTFMGYELLFSVASGQEFLEFGCRRGRVLYVDPELHVNDIQRRVKSITSSMGITSDAVAGMFDIVPLRGTTATAELLDMAIRKRVKATGKPYDLIIIDSINAILKGDENSSVDVRALFASLQRLTKDTGAACLTIHHEGKGLGKESGSRGRGSSVFLDGPDVCMELVPLRVDPDEAAAELLRAHAKTKPNGELIPATAWRLTFPKNRSGAPIRPIDLIFRHPTHIVDHTGELASCKVLGSSADYGESGGNAKGESYQKTWDTLNEIMDGIVKDIHAEGNKATRAVCLDVLNERRKAMGMRAWSKATFRNNTLRGGRLRYRVDPATDELYRLTDDQLLAESERGAVPNTP